MQTEAEIKRNKWLNSLNYDMQLKQADLSNQKSKRKRNRRS